MTRMQLSEEEWQEIQKLGPGVRTYKDKKKQTCMYVIYDKDDRNIWEVIIIFPGVEVIPNDTFCWCTNVKTVIMSDDVKRIETKAFSSCHSLEFIRLSRSLKFLGLMACQGCTSLPSVFIPDSCRQIDKYALSECKKLIIFKVPQHTRLGNNVVSHTLLFRKSLDQEEFVRTWVKNLNQIDTTTNIRIDKYAIHCLCSSMDPSIDTLYNRYICRFGL